MRPGLILLTVFLLNGCHLSHERPSSPSAPSDDASRRDAAVPVDVPRPSEPTDPMVPRPTDPTDPTVPPDGPLPSGETICEQWCNAAEAAGCARGGCVTGCRRRFEVAEDIGCTTEWKRATLCLALDPCRDDGTCGTDNGWPQCLRDPPGGG